MKKKHIVRLEFFIDDITGEYGLAHEKTINLNESFNAFWDGIGIFHDVFEHWFENQHKYFQNQYAMNIGGEISAMGAMWYYYAVLGVRNRKEFLSRDRGFVSINMSEAMVSTIENLCADAICYGYTNFGSTLECRVPRQKDTNDYPFESQISDLWTRLSSREVKTNEKEDRERAIMFKKSITYSKIANLYRWGYRMASKLVPNNEENMNVLNHFIEFWDTFCKKNDAETMYTIFSGIEFVITKDKNNVLSWEATFESRDGNNDFVLKSTQKDALNYYDMIMETDCGENFN